MRKFIALLLFLVSAVIIAGPKFEVTGGESIEAGSFQRGKEVSFDIRFKNSGDEDLKITGVSTSCGCSSALASGDIVKPGEEGSIKFTFNGQGFGKVSKNVMVSTNEADNNSHTLLVSMNMIDPISVNPQSIITEGKVGEELTQSASILNSLDRTVDIMEITSNTPVIKITSDKMSLNAGEGASLSIKIKIYEESAINAAIIIKTSEGEFQIPVLVEVLTTK